jgi:hypothetical protein
LRPAHESGVITGTCDIRKKNHAISRFTA